MCFLFVCLVRLNPYSKLSIKQPLCVDVTSIHASLLVRLKASLCASVWTSSCFIVTRAHLHLNYTRSHATCSQPGHPEFIANARWVLASDLGSAGGAGVWLGFNEARRSTRSTVSPRAGQTQIVADKINAANRYE